MMGRRAVTALMLVAIAAGVSYLGGGGATQAWLRVASKTLPVLALAAWTGRRGGAVALGLLASAAGDALLDLGAFLPGMAAFALAHAFYIAAFLRAEIRFRPWHAVPFVVWGIWAYSIIAPGLGSMAVPVALYMVIICAMMWRAAAQAWPSAHIVRVFGLAGAALFGGSDTLIALSRFAGIPAHPTGVMVSYWAGQFLIAAWARATARVGSRQR